jgi:hypothetical protein
MESDLRTDNVRQDYPSVANNGGGRLVARSLNAENVHDSKMASNDFSAA